MTKKIKETAAVLHIPPKMVYNDRGEMVEVILSYNDYKTFLHYLADYVDWELLPGYLQDAVDRFLADQARAEQGDEAPASLLDVMTDLGIDADNEHDH